MEEYQYMEMVMVMGTGTQVMAGESIVGKMGRVELA